MFYHDGYTRNEVNSMRLLNQFLLIGILCASSVNLTFATADQPVVSVIKSRSMEKFLINPLSFSMVLVMLP